MPNTKNIFCIVNPKAGGGRKTQHVAAALHDILGNAAIDYEIVRTAKKGDGTFLARNAVAAGYDVVVAVGGDGTVNEIATGLVGAAAALAIIPLGSGNGLARGLRIPLAYHDACQVLLRGRQRTIDVGQVNDRYFFATSGVGFDASVGKKYNEHPHHSRGFLPYCAFAFTEFFTYTPPEIRIAYHGQTFSYTPLILTIANIEQYGSGAIIAPDALPDDGLLDIIIIPQVSPLKMLQYVPSLFSGKIDRMPDFITHKTDAVTITRAKPGPVHVDGETFHAGETLEYTILPHALNVCVP